MSEREILKDWDDNYVRLEYFVGGGVSQTQVIVRALTDHGAWVETSEGSVWLYPWTSVFRIGGLEDATDE